MKTLSKCNVKPNTLRCVLNYLITHKNATRKDTAKACNISLVTAGKAIDFSLTIKYLQKKGLIVTQADLPQWK